MLKLSADVAVSLTPLTIGFSALRRLRFGRPIARHVPARRILQCAAETARYFRGFCAAAHFRTRPLALAAPGNSHHFRGAAYECDQLQVPATPLRRVCDACATAASGCVMSSADNELACAACRSSLAVAQPLRFAAV
jgi:hypothetical protein